MERTDFGMLVRCDQTDAYSGEGRPPCDNGKGCIACWEKHNKHLDATRPPMSADFKEFYDYISMFKRVVQSGRTDIPAGTLYDNLAGLERSIRTGDYRHKLIVFESILKEMEEIDGRKRGQ